MMDDYSDLGEWAVADCDAVLDFYLRALSAQELGRECLMDGCVVSARVRVGRYSFTFSDSVLVADSQGRRWPSPPFVTEPEHCSLLLSRVMSAGGAVRLSAGDALGRQWTVTLLDPESRDWTLARDG